MKRYKTRPGVVLTAIAGQYILVAVRSVRKLCPYITKINETAAFCWRLLERGSDLEDLTQKVSEEYEISDPSELRQDLESLLAQLLDNNYLIELPRMEDPL